MDHFKCAFSATLMGGEFACVKAVPVTRRSGPEMACTENAAHERCAALFEGLKQAALPAMGYEDDLLTMPHSALVKIQFGGLLGIRRLLGEEERGIDDIDALLQRAVTRFGDYEAVPFAELAGDIASYKLRRRS